MKLAKDCFFGEEVMVKCTVAGSRELPALLSEELRRLKHALLMLFPQFWRSPHEFNPCGNPVQRLSGKLVSDTELTVVTLKQLHETSLSTVAISCFYL